MTASIVVLAGQGRSTRYVVNALRRHFDIQKVIVEQRPDRATLLARRAKKLGLSTVAGQVLFQLAGLPLRRAAERRIEELETRFQLNPGALPTELVRHVESVNSDEVTAALQTFSPDAVVVNGTRIIAPHVLTCIQAPFVNMHAGITPAYRGVHGGYWALVNREPAQCGVTVHQVDPGIDTGGILYQATIHPESDDNFFTYPVHQVAAGLPLLVRAVEDCVSGREIVIPSTGPSRLWSHPTLWEYIYYRLAIGVR